MMEAVAAGAGLLLGAGLWGAYAPNSRLFGPVVGRGPRGRVIYLTFDDGPNPPVTERILEILELEQVPATFFMVGRHVDRYPATALAAAQAGHEIGNHTYSHIKLHRTGQRKTAEEIRRGHEVITAATGSAPRCFRAPHGYRSPLVTRVTAGYGYQTFGWTMGVWDSARPGAEAIRTRVRERLSPGSIVLLHDGDGYAPGGDRSQTADALRGILTDVRSAGYQLQSLSRLVAG